jgi:hypothetical protein
MLSYDSPLLMSLLHHPFNFVCFSNSSVADDQLRANHSQPISVGITWNNSNIHLVSFLPLKPWYRPGEIIELVTFWRITGRDAYIFKAFTRSMEDDDPPVTVSIVYPSSQRLREDGFLVATFTQITPKVPTGSYGMFLVVASAAAPAQSIPLKQDTFAWRAVTFRVNCSGISNVLCNSVLILSLSLHARREGKKKKKTAGHLTFP